MKLVIEPPTWLRDLPTTLETPAERMAFAVALSRRNVEAGTGGPFGAAIFAADSGTLLGCGVNSVERLNNSVLHAEVVAIMTAQAHAGTFRLNTPDGPTYEIYTSCEPCAMCLGACLWSGVRAILWAANRDDASAIGFDEGPVFPASHDYLRERGIRLDAGLHAEEARAVLQDYQRRSGTIYNG